MSAPVFTHSLNGMLTAPYTRKELGKIVTDQRPKEPKPTYTMAYNITPVRSDLAEIQAYLAAEEEAARWKKNNVYAYKPKSTEALMRDFLLKMIEKETARREEVEAGNDMPYAGVVADNIARQRRVREAIPAPAPPAPAPMAAAPPTPAPRERVRAILSSRVGRSALKRLAAERRDLEAGAAGGAGMGTPSEERTGAEAAVASIFSPRERRVPVQATLLNYFPSPAEAADSRGAGGPSRGESRWNSPTEGRVASSSSSSSAAGGAGRASSASASVGGRGSAGVGPGGSTVRTRSTTLVGKKGK